MSSLQRPHVIVSWVLALLLLWTTHHNQCSAFTTPPNQNGQETPPLTTVSSTRRSSPNSNSNNRIPSSDHFLERVDTLIDRGPEEQQASYARSSPFPPRRSSQQQRPPTSLSYRRDSTSRPYNYEQAVHNYRHRIPIGYRTADALRKQLEEAEPYDRKPSIMRISASSSTKDPPPKKKQVLAGLSPEEMVQASRAYIAEQQKRLGLRESTTAAAAADEESSPSQSSSSKHQSSSSSTRLLSQRTKLSSPQRAKKNSLPPRKLPRYKVKTMAARAKTTPGAAASKPETEPKSQPIDNAKSLSQFSRVQKVSANTTKASVVETAYPRDNRVEELIKAAANAKDRNFDANPAPAVDPAQNEDDSTVGSATTKTPVPKSMPKQPGVVKPETVPTEKIKTSSFVQSKPQDTAQPTTTTTNRTDSLQQRLENLNGPQPVVGKKVVIRDNKVETLIKAAEEQTPKKQKKPEWPAGTGFGKVTAKSVASKLQSDSPNRGTTTGATKPVVDPSSDTKVPPTVSPESTAPEIDSLHQATKRVIDIETVETVISRQVNDDFYDDVVKMRSPGFVRNLSKKGKATDVPMDVEFVKSSSSSKSNDDSSAQPPTTSSVSSVIDAVSSPVEQKTAEFNVAKDDDSSSTSQEEQALDYFATLAGAATDDDDVSTFVPSATTSSVQKEDSSDVSSDVKASSSKAPSAVQQQTESQRATSTTLSGNATVGTTLRTDNKNQLSPKAGRQTIPVASNKLNTTSLSDGDSEATTSGKQQVVNEAAPPKKVEQIKESKVSSKSSNVTTVSSGGEPVESLATDQLPNTDDKRQRKTQRNSPVPEVARKSKTIPAASDKMDTKPLSESDNVADIAGKNVTAVRKQKVGRGEARKSDQAKSKVKLSSKSSNATTDAPIKANHVETSRKTKSPGSAAGRERTNSTNAKRESVEARQSPAKKAPRALTEEELVEAAAANIIFAAASEKADALTNDTDATLATDAPKGVKEIKKKMESTGAKISDFASRFQESDRVRSAQLTATQKRVMLRKERRSRADASVFSFEAKKNVPPRTLQGVALMTAVLSTFVAGNDPITTAAAIPVTSFLGLCRGKTGNVTRALGDIAMDCVETVNTMFDEQQGNIVEALVLTSRAAITTVATGMRIYQQTREELARVNGTHQHDNKGKTSSQPSKPAEPRDQECKGSAKETAASATPTTYDDDLQGRSFPSSSDSPLHFASYVEKAEATEKVKEVPAPRETTASAGSTPSRPVPKTATSRDKEATTTLETMERAPATRPAVVEKIPFQILNESKAEVNARALLTARLELERMKRKKP